MIVATALRPAATTTLRREVRLLPGEMTLLLDASLLGSTLSSPAARPRIRTTRILFWMICPVPLRRSPRMLGRERVGAAPAPSWRILTLRLWARIPSTSSRLSVSRASRRAEESYFMGFSAFCKTREVDGDAQWLGHGSVYLGLFSTFFLFICRFENHYFCKQS